MRPGRAADHSPPSSAAVMEEKSYTSTYPGHTGPVTGSLYLSIQEYHDARPRVRIHVNKIINVLVFLDFKLSPCSICNIISFG